MENEMGEEKGDRKRERERGRQTVGAQYPWQPQPGALVHMRFR